MKTLKNIIKFIRDVIEVYIPMLALITLFAVFVIQVFCRYILNNPQTWTMEASLVCFVWLVLFGASFCARKKTHVTFKLIYDKLSNTKKHILSIAGNIIIIFAFAILIKPSYDYIKFMSFQSTYVLKLSFSLVYAPFLYFILSVIFYQGVELVESIISIKKGHDVEIIDRTHNTLIEEYIEKKMKGGTDK